MRAVRFGAKCLLLLAAATVVCLPQTLPGSHERAARLTTMSGQVSVIRDSGPWALHVGDWVQPRQEIHTGPDGYAVFEVSDGSTFEIFANSRATFRNNSGSLRDLVDLWIGRVKAHVQRIGGRPNPSRVTTPTAVISVRGTIFDVTVEDDDATTLVAVEEGQVTVQHALMPYGEPKVLNAGDSIRVFKNQPLAAQRIDKGATVNRVLRGAAEVLIYRGPRMPGGGGGTSAPSGGAGGPAPAGGAPAPTPVPVPGDTAGSAPPPPPPPPPPAPPKPGN